MTTTTAAAVLICEDCRLVHAGGWSWHELGKPERPMLEDFARGLEYLTVDPDEDERVVVHRGELCECCGVEYGAEYAATAEYRATR